MGLVKLYLEYSSLGVVSSFCVLSKVPFFLKCVFGCWSPMKLSGVNLSATKQSKNANDVLVNSRTKVAVVRHLPFAFEDNLGMISPIKPLCDIIRDVREYQSLSVIYYVSKIFFRTCICQVCGNKG